MIKMLLADDEPVITSGIQRLVDWAQIGIEICGIYHDGKTALQGIMQNQPQLAILDISMPQMTGIEILKQLKASGSGTKVIFLSGFQEFSYAHDALTYGAVDYLLKPVNKDALLRAVHRCLPADIALNDAPAAAKAPLDGCAEALSQLAQAQVSTYTVAAIQPLGVATDNALERQLAQFSLFDKLELFCRTNACGIAFQKQQDMYVIFTDAKDAAALLAGCARQAAANGACRFGAVLSGATSVMSSVPALAAACREKCRYFYFDGYLDSDILLLDAEKQAPSTEPREMQAKLAAAFVSGDRQSFDAAVKEYLALCAAVADGKRDAAVYHLLSARRVLQAELESIGISGGEALTDTLLDEARQTESYAELSQIFCREVDTLCSAMSSSVQKNNRRDIQKAIDYIDAHYRENLTLEVLAKHIHMNPYYFSSYFKKKTGQNFKDYLNQLRVHHAIELLISTDKRTYEIAEDVGFKDYRYFTELFNRHYGKTPTAYRKELCDAKQ